MRNIKIAPIFQLRDVNDLDHYLNREVKYIQISNFKQEEDDSSTESFYIWQSGIFFLPFMKLNDDGFEEIFYNISTSLQTIMSKKINKKSDMSGENIHNAKDIDDRIFGMQNLIRFVIFVSILCL